MGFTHGAEIKKRCMEWCPDAFYFVRAPDAPPPPEAEGVQQVGTHVAGYDGLRAHLDRSVRMLLHDTETDLYAQMASATSPTHLLGLMRGWLSFVRSVAAGADTYFGFFDTTGAPPVKDIERRERAERGLPTVLDAVLAPLRRLEGWPSEQHFLNALDAALAQMVGMVDRELAATETRLAGVRARLGGAEEQASLEADIKTRRGVRTRLETARAAGGFAFFMSTSLHDREFRGALRRVFSAMLAAGAADAPEPERFSRVCLDGIPYAPVVPQAETFCAFGVPSAAVPVAGAVCRSTVDRAMQGAAAAEPAEFVVGEHVIVDWRGPDARYVRRVAESASHGEADAKIIDMLRPILTEANNGLRPGDYIILRSRDTDVLARVLLALVACRKRMTPNTPRVLLDFGGSGREAVLCDMCLLCDAIHRALPDMRSPVHAFVMCCLLSGSDFTAAPPRVGFATLMGAFDGIGTALVREGVRARAIRDSETVETDVLIDEDAFALLLAAARLANFGVAAKRARVGTTAATSSEAVRLAENLLAQTHDRAWMERTIATAASAAVPAATRGRSKRVSAEAWTFRTDAVAVRQARWALGYFMGDANDCLAQRDGKSVWGWARDADGHVHTCLDITDAP